MDYEAEHEKVSSLIQDALSLLCKECLNYNRGFTLEGEVKVVIDTEQTFHIFIKDAIGDVPHVFTTAKKVKTGTL